MPENPKSETDKKEVSMLYYQLKLESCYLQSGAIKEDYKAIKGAVDRINQLIKLLKIN